MHQKVSDKEAYTAKETIRFCSAVNDNTFTVEPGILHSQKRMHKNIA
jgi:hypothetical protein